MQGYCGIFIVLVPSARAGDQATSREDRMPAADGQMDNDAGGTGMSFSVPASGEPQRLSAVVSAIQQLYSVYKVGWG